MYKLPAQFKFLGAEMTKKPDNPLNRAADAAGSKSELARKIGVTPGAVNNWYRRGVIPAERVKDIEAATGVPAAELRPDLFS